MGYGNQTAFGLWRTHTAFARPLPIDRYLSRKYVVVSKPDPRLTLREDVPPPSPSAQSSALADPTIVIAICQLTDAIKLQTLATLASSQDEREDVRKKVLAQ